jgi:hypothetical protein
MPPGVMPDEGLGMILSSRMSWWLWYYYYLLSISQILAENLIASLADRQTKFETANRMKVK